MRLGTFNFNNLFERAKVFQLENFSSRASAILNDANQLSQLLEKDVYEGNDKNKIESLLAKYLLDKKNKGWFSINVVKGKLYTVKRDKSGVTLAARGRNDWLGWVELEKEPVEEISIENTGKVVQAVNADILCSVEVESRPTLCRFNDMILKKLSMPYAHVMVIDGNDSRGIDVGILSKHEIISMISHVDDRDEKGNKIFSRDCAEYEIALPGGKKIRLLFNHLKSQGYGTQEANDAKRAEQAARVAGILSKYDLKNENIAVAGDFNDTPDSPALKGLLSYPHLRDVLNSPKYSGEKWTYMEGKAQIDYILLSDPLFEKIQAAGIERRGIFKKGNTSFPTVKDAVSQASDHAAVWVDIQI